MSTRSTYLARTLLTRLSSLNAVLAGEAESEARTRRRDLVAKVLVVEEGITEEAKIRFVLDALPSVSAARPVSERETRDLAASLEAQLWR